MTHLVHITNPGRVRGNAGLDIVANEIRHSVTRNGVEVFLSPQLFEIFSIISRAKHGVTPAQLFAALFANDPNGGPLSGKKAIHVQRRNLNKKLAPLGLHIRSAGSGFRDGIYEFEIVSGRPI